MGTFKIKYLIKMKKVLTILFAISLFVSVKAQTSFSCVRRDLTIWNDYTKKYEDLGGYSENSLFVVNDKETMFTHTISSMTSTYYVKEREYDAKNDVWTFSVVSDVGNEYYYIFDPKNYQVRAAYNYKGNIYMIVFTVKSIF